MKPAAAEGGALYDLTRWLGFYAEVAVGYVAGTETAVVNGSAVDQPGSPILALGFGVHVRVVD